MVVIAPAPAATLDDRGLAAAAGEILNRHPAVGLALAVVHRGGATAFHGHGFADLAARRPVEESSVFRIASVTKLFTAIAVMQLVERGMVELDLPANRYLRSYRLVPAHPGGRPATIRHLLTHTAGLPEIIRLADLLHPGWGSFGMRPAIASVAVGEPMPSLASYYRGALRMVVEPGRSFAYSNHGFATLGQLVEDVTGLPLARYFRECIFAPLGMADADLVRSRAVAAHLARGYEMGREGPVPVTDREWLGSGGGGIYASTRDLARFAAAILGGGANGEGRILEPETLTTMLEPHFQPDRRLPGMGLGFFRYEAGGHRLVGHDGRLPGFVAELLAAPDDGVALIGMTNGSSNAPTWLPIELERLLRRLIGVAEPAIRTDLPHRPETWSAICGSYTLPARVSDLRGRLAMPGGIEVLVRDGRPVARLRTPIPGLSRGLLLHPDDPDDPYLYRADLAPLGMPSVRVAFARERQGSMTELHTDLAMLSFRRRR
jgi:CubicO group peptidase (beta-lactamase class C family)